MVPAPVSLYVRSAVAIVFEGGVRYTGEMNKEGKREGHGECVWPNNDRYVGDFADGVKSGNGILYFANGDKRVKRVSFTCLQFKVKMLIY